MNIEEKTQIHNKDSKQMLVNENTDLYINIPEFKTITELPLKIEYCKLCNYKIEQTFTQEIIDYMKEKNGYAILEIHFCENYLCKEYSKPCVYYY